MRRGAIGQERRAQPMPDAGLGAEGRTFNGTAVVFDTWTQIGSPDWGFRERVMPGSLDKTLRESDVVFLDGHEPLRPISRMSAGTLRLIPTPTGLAVESDLDTGVSYVSDLARNVDNGNIKGMSFGFRVTKDEWATGDDGIDERTIREVELIEVSATAFPAYTTTDAAVRSAVIAAKCRRGGLTAAEVRSIKGLAARATPTDEDSNALATAIDAAIDEALDLHANGEDEQAWALISAADASVDALLELLGLPDPDENDEPADDATRDSDQTEPADATRAAVARNTLALRRLAAFHGLPV